MVSVTLASWAVTIHKITIRCQTARYVQRTRMEILVVQTLLIFAMRVQVGKSVKPLVLQVPASVHYVVKDNS